MFTVPSLKPTSLTDALTVSAARIQAPVLNERMAYSVGIDPDVIASCLMLHTSPIGNDYADLYVRYDHSLCGAQSTSDWRRACRLFREMTYSSSARNERTVPLRGTVANRLLTPSTLII